MSAFFNIAYLTARCIKDFIRFLPILSPYGRGISNKIFVDIKIVHNDKWILQNKQSTGLSGKNMTFHVGAGIQIKGKNAKMSHPSDNF